MSHYLMMAGRKARSAVCALNDPAIHAAEFRY
jgi:hypothetical protein